MGGDDDITRWLASFGDGAEGSAAEALWRTYFEKLTRLARAKLDKRAGNEADEEDVALSAMHSFYRGMAAGKYPQLNGRDDLWRLLVSIVAHKVSHQRRRNLAAKRGSGRGRGESVFKTGGADESHVGFEQVLGREPTPEVALMLAENCEILLAQLGDDGLQRVARLRLEGFTNEEIATKLACTTRSIERKLQRIRDKWGESSRQ